MQNYRQAKKQSWMRKVHQGGEGSHLTTEEEEEEDEEEENKKKKKKRKKR